MDYKNDVLIYDIETPLQIFLCNFYDVSQDKFIEFEISAFRNDLYSLIKYLETNKSKYFVGWNNLDFDAQVIEYLWRNFKQWFSLSGLQISKILHERANFVIDNKKHELFPDYREYELSFNQIDLFKVHHLDNKNRISNGSLKAMEYYLDMDLELFDFQLDRQFDEEAIQELKYYCNHDLKATYQMYLLTIGETDNPSYKDNNQIEIRENIRDEYNIPCMNYSNSKIGDEIIKKFYCEETGIDYKDLSKKGTFRKEIKLKFCVPKYIKFETEQLKTLVKDIKSKVLKQDESYDNKFKFFNETYTLARGGLHTASENKIYHSDEDIVIIDADVASFYVKASIEREYFPYHLGKSFLKGYKRIYDERIRLKPLSKTDKRVKGIVQGLKEAGVSVYGKSSDMQSWLFDKQMTLSICISGELSLLMLIEKCELSGYQCIMANTDGATFLVTRKELDNFYNICKDWEQMTNYELEYAEFKSMWFSNVNNYIALKADDSVKKKGDSFLTEHEIFKDKSFKILPLALEQHFINNVKPEDFIPTHKILMDFCSRGKVNRDFYLKAITKEGQELNYNRLIRYYLSKEGVKLYKVKKDTCETNAAKISEVVAGHKNQTVLNIIPKNPEEHFQNIDYQWYINKCKEIIFKIEAGRKPKKNVIINENQLNLF